MKDTVKGRYHQISEGGEVIFALWERTQSTAFEGWSRETRANLERLCKGWDCLPALRTIIDTLEAKEAAGEPVRASEVIKSLRVILDAPPNLEYDGTPEWEVDNGRET